MKFSPTSIIAYFLQLFTLPKVKKEVKKYANMFLGESSRFTSGMNIQILPTAFYNTEKKDILTIEGIKKDLKRIIFRKKL